MLVRMQIWCDAMTKPVFVKWAASSEFGTYRLCEQRRFRRACASAQSCQNLRCSLIQAVSEEEPSDRKPDPWPLWMAGHAQLKFVMTECSKTQIRLGRSKCKQQRCRSDTTFVICCLFHIIPVCAISIMPRQTELAGLSNLVAHCRRQVFSWHASWIMTWCECSDMHQVSIQPLTHICLASHFFLLGQTV